MNRSPVTTSQIGAHAAAMGLEALESRTLTSSSQMPHADAPRPTAIIVSAATIVSPETKKEEIVIRFSDRRGINASSISARNLRISGGLKASHVSLTSNNHATSILARYDVAAPRGGWHDGGDYSFSVKDVANTRGARALAVSGSFSVAVVPNTAPQIVSISASTPVKGGTFAEVAITYHDDDGIDPSSINTGNIITSDPSIKVTSAAISDRKDARTLTATYTISAPLGGFASGGQFQISTGASAVDDKRGAAIVAQQTLRSSTAKDEPAADLWVRWIDESSDSLFGPDGPTADDVRQGQVGDCYFLATLASIALHDPNFIREHIHSLGDGQYTVTFSPAGVDEVIMIDANLPVDWSGAPIYAKLGGGDSLWVALFEKAFVYLRSEQRGSEASYSNISGGWSLEVYSDLGIASQDLSWDQGNGSQLAGEISAELAAGKSVTLGTSYYYFGPLVGGHMYTVIAARQEISGQYSIQVRNPWGFNPITSSAYLWVSADAVAFQVTGVCSATV